MLRVPKPVNTNQTFQFDYINSKLMLKWDSHFKANMHSQRLKQQNIVRKLQQTQS